MPVVGHPPPAFHQGGPGAGNLVYPGQAPHFGPHGDGGFPGQGPRGPGGYPGHPNGNGSVPLPQMSFQPQPQPMTMHDQAEAARLAQDYEALVSIIKQWNANRLDLFALTLPNEVGQILQFIAFCFCV